MKKIVILILGLCFLCPLSVSAQDIQEETQEQLFEEFDMNEIEDLLKKIFPEEKIGFKDTVLKLINGETEFTFGLIKDMILDQFTYEFQSSKSSMVQMMMILLMAAIFRNFSSVFQNNQVSELSFYVLYMLLVTICIEGFRILMVSVETGIDNMLTFLELLGPIYFLAVAIATGSMTSVAFYNIILFTIYVVEMLILNIILPMIHIYMVVRILNDLSSEEMLSKMTDLLQTVIVWALRTLIAAIAGINTIQGLLSPAIDYVKRSILTRGGEAIPIIGNAVGGVTEIVLGTAVLIKNGIGLTGAIICLILCMGPIIQMAMVTLMYKMTAALAQPVSDKRMIGCVSSMADGATLLLRVVITSCALFLISIAVAAQTVS